MGKLNLNITTTSTYVKYGSRTSWRETFVHFHLSSTNEKYMHDYWPIETRNEKPKIYDPVKFRYEVYTGAAGLKFKTGSSGTAG